MVEWYLQGGFWMHPILICAILGLAIAIERFWALTRASVNTRKFLEKVKEALNTGGVPAAIEVCANTRGPVASVFQAGLLRADKGIDHVEKAIVNAGGIESAFLERGLIWISTIIAVAPMLGFTGTVSGMISAFDAIAAANDISPAIVASGIAEALLTTLFGLAVAMPAQALHNFFVSRVDRLVLDMEESAVELVDTLALMEMKK
jgi:biopolymer transport protein ExbB